MTYTLFGIGILALVAAVGLIGSFRFSQWTARLVSRLEQADKPVDVSAKLPDRLRDFALRADARPGDLAHAVRFTQSVEMQLKPGAPWQPMQATQVVAIGEAGFVWQAQQSLGPIPKFQVVDAFVGGMGWLRVRLLGLVRVANASGPELSRGEAMRYLAELPWSPDAILGNPAISWRELGDCWVEATMQVQGDPAAVRLRFDVAGDIAEVYADARETTDDQGNAASYPWQGFFRDYKMIGPRRIPAEAEVGYVRPDGYRAYFQGRITGYDVLH